VHIVMQAESAVRYAKFWSRKWQDIKKYDWRRFKDPDVKRQFQFLSTLGSSILPEAKLRQVGNFALICYQFYS